MTIKSLKRKLHMDGHHRIEFFGVAFAAFCVVIIAFFCVAMKQRIDATKYKMTGRTILSQGLPWSQTGTTCNVTGLYRNAAGTKAMIWIKMSDMKMLSTDPNTYSIYINAFKDQSLTHPMTGSLYLFGDTGNMALILNDNMGFENTCIDVVLRSAPVYKNTEFQNPYSDPSFVNNNQVQFSVNCGGSDATIVDFLDKSTIEPRDMYYAGVLDYAITSAQLKLNGFTNVENKTNSVTLAKLRDDAAMVEDYRNRLIDYGFVIPALPAQIVSDYVSSSPISIVDKPMQFDESMLNIDSAIISTQYGTAEGDNRSMTDSEGIRYYYASDFVYPGGINVNINDAEQLQDILDTLKPAELTYLEWRSVKEAEAKKYASTIKDTYNVKSDSWQINSRVYERGTNEMYDKAIEQYTSAVSKLMADKKKYETKDIYEVFDYVSELETVADNVRMNGSQDLITVWNKYN